MGAITNTTFTFMMAVTGSMTFDKQKTFTICSWNVLSLGIPDSSAILMRMILQEEAQIFISHSSNTESFEYLPTHLSRRSFSWLFCSLYVLTAYGFHINLILFQMPLTFPPLTILKSYYFLK